jgi:sugar phosphate isomerase/epimerase
MIDRLGVAASTLGTEPRLALRAAVALGFRGVQFDISGEPGGGGWLSGLDRSGQREFVKVLAGANVRLLSLAASAGRRGFSVGADIDRALSHLERCLNVSADLGRTAGQPVTLCVDLGPLPPPRPPATTGAVKKPVDTSMLGLLVLPTADEIAAATAAKSVRFDEPDEAAERMLDSALSELGRLADRYSVVIAFRSELGSLAALERALSAAGCPYFGLDLDPVAVLREPVWTLEEALAAFTGRVLHVRARDGLKGTGGRTQSAELGRGHTDWVRLFRLLEDASFKGPVVVDPTELRDRPAGATAALAMLKSLVA